jgi:putative aldouronate transport system permease protein
MLMPALLYFVVFKVQSIMGMSLAFYDYRIVGDNVFVGMKHFKDLFSTPMFWQIMKNTLIISFTKLIIITPFPVAFAILLSEVGSGKLKKLTQVVSYLPHFLSWVVISYFVYAFLSTDKGLFNSMIVAMGGERIRWYQDEAYWPYILVFINTWKTFGYSMVVYMATITGIDQSLYESAVIDGATKWQQCKGITIPMLRPVISIMFILNVGNIFTTDFGLFYQVTRDSNSIIDVTQTLDVYVYKATIESSNYGYSAAVSLLQNTLGCILLIVANLVVKRIDPESGLF